MDLNSILFLIFLVFASAYFSASETALFSLPLTKIKAYKETSSPRKRLIAKLVLEPKDLLVTVFMMNTLVNILIQNTTSHMFGEEANWLYKVGIPFMLLLFLGEIIPKNIGLQKNVKIANLVAPSIDFIQKFISPIRNLTVKITEPVSRILFFFLKNEKSISNEEMQHVLKTSQERGVLLPEEVELVSGYLKLQEATVKELMRPKNDILYYDINDPLSKLMYLFVEQECTRMPICNKTLDNVLGIITAPRFFLNRKEIKESQDLIKYSLNPLFVPENTSAKALIKRFDESGQVLALVVDEYGSITGLITKEDIIEQVIGDISDLRDAHSLYIKSGPNEIIASGLLELTTFNEYFQSHLISENNLLTIGGWLTEQLGEIPKSSTKVEIQGFMFQVLAADPNKIRRLYIRKLKGS